MNNKDIKKQPSAQALSDDDLESVAGGYTEYILSDKDFTPKPMTKLNKAQAKELQDLGYTLEITYDGVGYVKDPNGNYLTEDQIHDILGAR